MSYFITNSVTKRRLSYKKLSHPSDSPLPPRGHRPPRSGRADAGGGRSAQRGRWQRGRAAAPRTYRRRRRRCCRWIGSSCPPHGKGRCTPSAHCVRHFPRKRGKLLCRYPKPSRYHGEGGPRERWKGHKTGAVIRSLSLRQQPLVCIDFQRITDQRFLRFSRWRPMPRASCACRRGYRRRAPSSSHRRGAALPVPW